MQRQQKKMTDDIVNRANEIMAKEPVTTKTAEILASFLLPLNSRPIIDTNNLDDINSINATHGTNFATIISC